LNWIPRPSLRIALCVLAALSTGCGADHEALPCSELPGRAVRTLYSPHIAYASAPHEPYNSTPPTSGPHVPWTVTPGIYRDELDEEVQVHALEHGHVLIQYGPGTGAGERASLEMFGRRHPDQVIVAPFDALSTGVALTAWGRIERLPGANPRAIERFVSALSGRYDHGWKHGARPCVE
jgi:Protein of unknown function (DUF3105)